MYHDACAFLLPERFQFSLYAGLGAVANAVRVLLVAGMLQEGPFSSKWLILLRCDKLQDVDDPDRLDIPEVHISFYFTKYFKKTLNPQALSALPASFQDSVVGLLPQNCE